MKVRAIMNGNIEDLPADHPLVVAGVFVPVEESGEAVYPAEVVAEVVSETVFTPSAKLDEALEKPRKPVAPMGTKSMPAARRTPPKRRK